MRHLRHYSHHHLAHNIAHMRKFLYKYRNIGILVLSLVIVIAGLGIIWVATLKIPDLHAFEARRVAQSTKIYDRTGEIVLYDVHENAKRTVVPLSEISPFLQKATIAIEDDKFYEHHGIRPLAILRAAIANVSSIGYSQGGSTITQQVVKNSILTKDKTITRKLKEAVLAIKLERVISKDEILETYLNETPYGGTMYGVEEASKTFFGKHAKDVTLGEAAFIAAVAQAPTYYSPYGSHKDKLLQRRNLVLRQMRNNGFITDAEYKDALEQKVAFLNRTNGGIKAPHFALFVKEYLVEKYGEDFVEQGGLKVITTLDYALQQKAEETIQNFIPDLKERFDDKINTGLVAIDPKSGDILAMVGSRDYFDKNIDGNFNITTAHRQPGSSFKPFVYASAFNEGYTPETMLFDVKTEFNVNCTPDGKTESDDPEVKCYSPDEYDHKFPGPMTMREALAQSRNIPAVQTLYLTGIKNALQLANEMGIEGLEDANHYGLTLVLGGGEVSLLDLTSGYSVFANDGVRNPYRSVLKVIDSKGTTIEEYTTQGRQVLPENTARLISNILSDEKVRIASIRQLLRSSEQPIAVKTGTTNDTRDVWTLGYTPNIAIGIWAGHNDNTPISKDKTAGLIIAPVWSAFALEAVKMVPREDFTEPEPTPSDLKPALRGFWQGGQSYFIDTATGNLANDATPDEFRQEMVINNVHNILHWVDKDNPRGPIPHNPAADPQYNNWEYAVRTWYSVWGQSHPDFLESGAFTGPSATDGSTNERQAPRVSITIPSSDVVYQKSEKIVTSISARSQSGYPITKVEYYINGKYLGTATTEPFSISFIPEDVSGIKRSNILKVVVFDKILNKTEEVKSFRVEL
jgi:penicillin-binding protein 1C